MKKLILLSLTVIASQASFAQEKKQFEVKNFEGMVSIVGPSSGLTIEGHNGKNVVIVANVGEDKVPERASGLKLVTVNGTDNTGLAATVDEKTYKMVVKIDAQGEEIKEDVRVLSISLPNSTNLFTNYTIKIPHNVNVIFKENLEARMNSEPFVINSLVGDLELNCWRCDVKISKFSGNLIANAKTVFVQFTQLSQDKISSISSNGDVEIVLPSEAKANLVLNSYRGNVYTDFDLTSISGDEKANEFSKGFNYSNDGWGTNLEEKSKAISIKGRGITEASTIFPLANVASGPSFENIRTGKRLVQRPTFSINGGGVTLTATSMGGNLYLRKK
jgi:hypothetical protein